MVLLKSDNWQDYVDPFASTSISMKARTLLEVIHRNSEFFGSGVEFSHKTDWPLIAAKGPEDCWAILSHVQATNHLAQRQSQQHWALTWEGWEAIEPIAGEVPGIGFVAMAFKPELDAVFENGIRTAIETDCGLNAVRIDRKHFGEKICDRILVEIKRAQFVVADFTFQRGGVYFETGYALALGRPVIWLCRADQVADLHFDTRQYPHILWSEPEDLRVQLRDRVRALIPGARTA
jgi:nucleoside 2-deoxyribosyltransferase